MLFRKRIPRSCRYCTYGTKIGDEQILCIKQGITSVNSQCRKFSYDPCKRIPMKPRAMDFKKFDDDDFTL